MTITSILVVVFGAYFALVLGPVAASPQRAYAFSGLVIAATVVTALLAGVSHVLLAIVFRSLASGQLDTRGKLIALRSEQASGYVLAVGVFTGIVLAMMQADGFCIAQALIASWVAAEITNGTVKVVLYRRGG